MKGENATCVFVVFLIVYSSPLNKECDVIHVEQLAVSIYLQVWSSVFKLKLFDSIQATGNCWEKYSH